jgi:hypothetical protein
LRRRTHCVIISDQHFPPALPAAEKRFCVVLRLEDCMLNKQPGILKEFFSNRQGYLPQGSLLLFGSLSHLAARGLESYAEETVKTFKAFANMLNQGTVQLPPHRNGTKALSWAVGHPFAYFFNF